MSELNRLSEQTIIGIVTCNREEMMHKLIKTIDPSVAKKIFIIVAGDAYNKYPENVEVIKCNRSPTVVGIAKTTLLRHMYNWKDEDGNQPQFFFLLEEDIEITNNKVFERYIETAADSGLWHFQLSYGTHGGVAGGNVNPDGTPIKRASVKYTNHMVDFYQNSFQCFTLCHRDSIRRGFLYDPRFLNAAEHLSQHAKIFKEKCGTPFRWFGDIQDSHTYIQDQDSNHASSVIRKDPEFHKNFSYSWQLFKQLWGSFPNAVEDTTHTSVMGILEELENNLANKQLL